MSTLSGVLASDIRDAAFGITIPVGPQVDMQIERLIDKAEIIVLSEVPRLAERLADGSLSRTLLASEIEDMVIRVVRNPDAKKSESIDDYSWELDAALAGGRLYLGADALARLSPGARRGTVGNIRLSVPAWRMPR